MNYVYCILSHFKRKEEPKLPSSKTLFLLLFFVSLALHGNDQQDDTANQDQGVWSEAGDVAGGGDFSQIVGKMS